MAGRQGQRRYWRERERRVNTPPLGAPSGQEEHGGGGGPATNERPRCAPDWASVRAPAPSWDSRDLSPSVPHIGEPLVHRSPPPSCFPAVSDPGDREGSFGRTQERRLERCLARQQGARKGLASPALRTVGFPHGHGAGSPASRRSTDGEGNFVSALPFQRLRNRGSPTKEGKGIPSFSWAASFYFLPPGKSPVLRAEATLTHLCGAGACPSPGWDARSSGWTRPPPRAGT